MTTVIPIGFADFSIEMQNVLSGRSSFVTGGVDTGGNLDPSNVAQAVFDSFTIPLMLARMDDDVTILGATVRQGTDGASLIGQSTSAPEAGTRVTESQSANSAVLINKRTALGGRKNRGRWFIPWFAAESNVNEVGILQASEVTVIQAAVTASLAAFASAPIDGMVILHDDASPPPHTPTPVIALQVSSLIGTQRRRLGR